MRIILLSTFLFFLQLLNAQTPWTLVPSNFEFNAQIDAVVVLDGAEVTNGYLGAFVGDECRGIVDGEIFPMTGKTIFSLIVFSNQATGEFLSFRYYEPVEDIEYSIKETVEFDQNLTGDALNPFYLTASSNNAPVATCMDQSTLPPAPGPITFDLCAIFSDPDGDDLTYTAVTSEGGSTNWTSACELEFTTAPSGTTTLSLTASDGSLEASCNYSFTVTTVNQSPVIDQPVGMVILDEGFGTSVIDLSTVFSDPDDDPLTYSATSQDAGIVSVSVSGSSLTITEVAAGNTEVTVTASDGDLSVQDIATIVVVGTAPALPWSLTPSDYQHSGQIDAVVRVNGAEVKSGVLAAFVGNECRGIVEGTFFPFNGRTIFSLIAYSNESSGDMLTFRYYDPNNGLVQVIDEVIEFESEMVLGNATDPVLLNIASTNNLPVVENPLPDQAEDEHFASLEIDLSNVFSDPDGDNLTYIASVINETIASAAVSGSTLTLTEAGNGTTVVEVFASDGEFSIVDRFSLTVNAVNDPPVVVNAIPDQLYQEGFGSASIPISGTFSDPEAAVLSYSASSSDETIVTVRIQGGNVVLTEHGFGSATVSVCVNDGEFEVCDPFEVVVEEVNESPVADCAGLTDQERNEGFGSFTIVNVCGAFSDPDDDALTYTVTSSDVGVATVSIDACVITVTETGTGTATIDICASDGEFQVCCSFVLTINFVNDPPVVVNPVANLSLVEGFASRSVSIATTFSDPENDALTYNASSSDENVVTVAVSGTDLTITETGAGSATVTVCANDGELEVCDSFDVLVEELNNSPVANCSGDHDATLMEGFGSYKIDDVCASFSDPDGDALTYSVASSDEGVATASLDACQVTVTEAGIGTTTITICASDGEFEVCCSLTVDIYAENELSLFAGGEEILDNDSLKYCADTVMFVLTVTSGIPWSIETSGDWFTADKINETTARIFFAENTSGSYRTGSFAVRDTQDHVVSLVLFQSASCIPDAVDDDLVNDFRVYPNPVQGLLTIEMSEAWISDGEVTVKLFGADGRRLKEMHSNAPSDGLVEIDMRAYQDGIYYLLFEKEGLPALRIPVIRQQ